MSCCRHHGRHCCYLKTFRQASANVEAVGILKLQPGSNLQFEATKDIEAGQEVLVRYGGAQWFESKNIRYSDFDYVSTMWRPDLQPLPCREDVNLTIGEDGRPIFSVPDTLPSGTVMDVSLCVKVSLIIVDQFVLWDAVLIDPATETVCVPLSYAAHISTTPDPDLANVRVSLYNMEHNVTGSTNIIVSVITTQELYAGEILLRYKAKAIEDDISVFSAQSRDELTRAVYDCCRDDISSENNDPSRLHGPIGNWDVSKVTDMDKVFRDLETFDYTLYNWDVSRVTDMTGMFDNALSFNQDLSNWDVSHVSDMTSMFHAAKAFNQDLSNWDVSRVTKMTVMFHNAMAFNQDLCYWNVSRVTDMGALFGRAISFNQDLSKWDVSRVVDMQGMFAKDESFNQDLSTWDVSCVTDMKMMFGVAASFNQDLSKWDVSRVTNMQMMFANATSFNQDLSTWDVSRVTDMQGMFADASSFQQTLCGAAWVNSNASKVDMFTHSLGSISDTAYAFSPQSWDELKRAVDDCAQLSGTDRV